MSFAAPFHVPAHLYCDLELKAFAAQFEDPFVGIQALQDRGELIYMRDIGRGTPGWVPTRFEILSDIFMDAKRFAAFLDNPDSAALANDPLTKVANDFRAT